MPDTEQLQTIPVGPLAFIPMSSCTTLGKQVDHYLAKWRNERENEHTSTIHFNGYLKDSYIISAKGSNDYLADFLSINFFMEHFFYFFILYCITFKV